MKTDIFLRKCLLTILIVLAFIVALVVVVDPYFHFHKPLKGLSYRLYDERYTNDGISRHFEFDSMITGSSMNQNFKTSLAEELFGGQFVKETFSGAGYEEVAQNIERTIKYNPDLKTVIWGIDYNGLIRDKHWAGYDNYPTYLYDDSLLNDVSYIFNKDILYHGVLNNLAMTITGQESTTMDKYSSWEAEDTGLDGIFKLYDRNNVQQDLPSTLTAEDESTVVGNVTDNIVMLANRYPNVEFILFFPPYSICYWDEVNLTNTLERQLKAEEVATSLLLECPNIKLYSFADHYDLITDVSKYRDKEHYLSDTNDNILRWIKDGDGLVTTENYLDKIAKEREYYGSYDYESIYN